MSQHMAPRGKQQQKKKKAAVAGTPRRGLRKVMAKHTKLAAQKELVIEKDPHKAVGKSVDGKLRLRVDGRKAMNRKFDDLDAWFKRREQESAPPGGWPTPPAHWPEGVRVDLGRPVPWLPPGWGQGVKTTCIAKLTCYIPPKGSKLGRMYYHKHVVAQLLGQDFEKNMKRRPNVVWAQERATLVISEKKTFDRKEPKFVDEAKLFANLDDAERRCLPKSAKDLHFAVVSARRADDERGVRNIANVQANLLASGAEPVWYVDAKSLPAYQALGLNAKVGGKLVPARNMALRDAAKAGKACVQVSDDILRWDYYVGELCRQADIHAGNAAARASDQLRVSPGAAARFLLAKLRASDGARLAGVYPLGNTGQAFSREAASSDHFILGDFFVADKSPVRFDPRMTLKEDYDFSCAHLKQHGAVLRCNRMIITAVHETNAGGAVSERDDGGAKERENIKILREKWPGVFRDNPTRGDTQVIMCWRRYKGE